MLLCYFLVETTKKCFEKHSLMTSPTCQMYQSVIAINSIIRKIQIFQMSWAFKLIPSHEPSHEPKNNAILKFINVRMWQTARIFLDNPNVARVSLSLAFDSIHRCGNKSSHNRSNLHCYNTGFLI